MSGDQAKISVLCREAERLEEDALYSSKGHFNAEDTWGRRNYWLGVPATAFGVIAGAALVKSQPEWASAFTLLASLLTGLMTFHKLSEHAAIHRAVAGQFLALRNEACFFREIELLETDRLYELPERLKALSSARNTSSSYAQWVNDEITRAKIIVANVRQYEKDEMPVTPENEIKKLFRF